MIPRIHLICYESWDPFVFTNSVSGRTTSRVNNDYRSVDMLTLYSILYSVVDLCRVSHHDFTNVTFPSFLGLIPKVSVSVDTKIGRSKLVNHIHTGINSVNWSWTRSGKGETLFLWFKLHNNIVNH